MAYRKREWHLNRGIMVIDDHTWGRTAKGEHRGKREKPSTESRKRNNHRKKVERCLKQLRHYFKKDDYFVTMVYGREERPADLEEAKRDRKTVYEFLKKEYARRGETLRWICNIECGSKGAWHMHWVLNRIQDTDILMRRAWEKLSRKGSINYKLLYEQDGNMSKLAEYMAKDQGSTARAKEQGGCKSVLMASDLSASRNMPIPEPKVREIRRSETWHKIRIPDGWYLDFNSYFEGLNPYSGYRYRQYWLLPLEEKENMYRTHVYIAVSSTAPKNTAREWAYMLECEGHDTKKEGRGEITATYHRANLAALLEALSQFKENAEITIHCEDEYVLTMMETRLPHWAAAGYRNTRGGEVKDRDLWELIWQKARYHKINTAAGRHQYIDALREKLVSA